RARDSGLGGRGIGGVGPSRTDLQVDGEWQQAATDQPERRVPTDGSESFSGEIGLPACYAGRDGQRTDAQRSASAPAVAAPVVSVGPGVVTADRDPGPALRTAPHRLA